jgi:FAD-dependent urate hydroxylase
MKALVIGGGIAGPVVAVAMKRAGIESVVYEAHPAPAEYLGLFLGLGVNGMRVLRDLGLLDAVMRGDTIPTPEMAFSSTTGRALGVVSNGWVDPETPSVTLMRGTLQQALADGARARGVDLRYGKRLVEYRTTARGVVAAFDDGSEAEGDVLVGADGIHSHVRGRMLPEAPAPSYTGLLNLGGIVPASGLPPTPGRMHMVWGRRAFFGYTVRDGGEAWWFANVGRRDEPARGELSAVPAEEWKHRLRELFADDPPFIARLVEDTAEIGASPIHDMPSLPAWHRDGVVLVGDAAHAVSPSAGQGASMAIEDAIVLARCLRDVTPTQAALARYEALRRPRAEKVVAVGRKRGAYKALDSRAAIWLRDLFMPLAFRFFATEKATSWIHDYEVSWDEPASAPAPRG